MAAGFKAPPGRSDVWERFRNDKELLASHHVTEQELEFLETVALFGSLASVRDILFILDNIRPSGRRK
jgi:hypothetical protein